MDTSMHTTDDGPNQEPNDQGNSSDKYLNADENILPTLESITEDDQPQTNNSKPVTDTMEVHHHTHHPKKWKEYFWEFFMLFLAVFCGFLAEYQLEQTIERHREKEYMGSLYRDIQTDIGNLKTLEGYIRDRVKDYDSLFSALRNDDYSSQTANIYYWGRRVIVLTSFYPAEGTINQLENAGGLRLIRNRAIVDSIQAYRLLVSRIKNLEQFESGHFMKVRDAMGKIFDADVIDIMTKDGTATMEKLDKNYPLMPFTKGDLNEFHVPMNFIRANKLSRLSLILRLQKKGEVLMKMIEDKYGIHP